MILISHTNVPIQCSEVKSSYNLEKEGLDRVLKYLKDVGLLIIINNNKWIREEHSEVKHYYCVWQHCKGEFQM